MKTDANRRAWLEKLAALHLEKWEKTGDIKLLKIAYDLKIESSYW
jgi:hypothetical protein